MRSANTQPIVDAFATEAHLTSASDRCTRCHETALATLYASSVLSLSIVLHPELKAFYTRGGGAIKNTTSFIDTSVAALALLCLHAAEKRYRGSAGSWRTYGLKLKRVFPPALFIFLVISLATLANFLSFTVWTVLAPADLIFTVPLVHHFQGVRADNFELAAIFVSVVGSLIFAVGKVRTVHEAAKFMDVSMAVVVTLCARVSQSLQVVLLRNACRTLSAGSGGHVVPGERLVATDPALKSSVLEVAALKMVVVATLCLPYALFTEGVEPWRTVLDANFWLDWRGTLLAGSVLITALFQFCNVGFSAEVGSLNVVFLTTAVAPLVNIVLVVVLGAGFLENLAEILSVKPLNHVEMVGVSLQAVAVVLYSFGRQRRLRTLAHQNLER